MVCLLGAFLDASRLVTAIEQTHGILGDLREFNQERWIVHYPMMQATQSTQTEGGMRRSQSLRPGQSFEEQDVQLERERSSRPTPPALQRCATTGVCSSAPTTPRKVPSRSSTGPAEEEPESAELSVLRLDLKLGAASNNPQALVHSLEKSSVAQLLDSRMGQAVRHLENLKQRISDTQSKVLVTGDLNAGKSTFVNALLRREVMPTDQQPCTTVFCEVLDAAEANGNVEEVHMLKPGVQYDVKDEDSYTRHTIDELENIVAEAEEMSPEDAPILKAYVHDRRQAQESLIHNGVVDIALIDAPGLNRDSLKTTALFARQEEIDVVVFVVSAENHFTLSAKEFLWNASNEKAYVFIVVNRFDQIRNKEKCKRLVLEQIRQLSPRTYEDAEDLVHFVDSSAVLGGAAEEAATPMGELNKKVEGVAEDVSTSFGQLEAALRDFVLLKRSKSKLLPAQTYVLRLLGDVDFLASTNALVAQGELEEARAALELARPALQQCQATQNKLEGVLEGEEDEVVTSVVQDAQRRLNEAVERVGRGEPADASSGLPPYPGLLNVWAYVKAVRHALVSSLDTAVRGVEDAARGTTADAVGRVKKMGETHLPEDAEKSQRVFIPEAMYAKRRTSGGRGLGFAGLGLGAEVIEVRISDIFDAHHHIAMVSGMGSSGKEGKNAEEEQSLISSLSLGLGALTIVGGRTLGAKTAVEAIVRVGDLLGNATARRWAGPVVALASAGLIIYFVIDLPNSIPRNVGRSLKQSLLYPGPSSNSTAVIAPENASTDITTPPTFAALHAGRVSRETRKVLRLASWDLQERFRIAIAARRAEVERQEGKEKSADEAMQWFEQVGGRTEEVRSALQTIKSWEN